MVVVDQEVHRLSYRMNLKSRHLTHLIRENLSYLLIHEFEKNKFILLLFYNILFLNLN
jgi:endonuclease III